jgi:hypothetical protein
MNVGILFVPMMQKYKKGTIGMTRDDIIRMVRASAVEIYGPMPDEKMYDIFIERCARLIDMGCADAIAAEREECARLIERDDSMRWSGAADAIRARGQQ